MLPSKSAIASEDMQSCHSGRYQILKAGVPAPQETSRAADIGPKSYRQRPQVPSSMPHASRHTVFGATCWGRCAAPRRAVLPVVGNCPTRKLGTLFGTDASHSHVG
jgi:hypothetical protein